MSLVLTIVWLYSVTDVCFGLSLTTRSVLPAWATIRVEDLVVQRALQVTSQEYLVPAEARFLLNFLQHNLSPDTSDLDGLLCHGEEYLSALKAAPRRRDGIEPSRLAVRVVNTAEKIIDSWIDDLEEILHRSIDIQENVETIDTSETLERFLSVKGVAELVDNSITQIAKAPATGDLVPEFIHGPPTQERGLLQANADLAVVAAFAASYVPPLVEGTQCTTIDILEALRHWSPPPDLPGGYLVQTDKLADKLEKYRFVVAREAVERLDDYRQNDLSEFALGF